jgi:hypothetical protein
VEKSVRDLGEDINIGISDALLNLPNVSSINTDICDNTEFYTENDMKIALNAHMLSNIAIPRSINKKICDAEFHPKQKGCDWVVSWGYPTKKIRHSVSETGFFWDAMHIDTRGCYQFSSLNTASGCAAIHNYSPPEDICNIIKNSKIPNSKYRQPNAKIDWKGVVFASQNPSDRSVHSVASTKDWWAFYNQACKHYGKDLLVKLHPWNKNEVEERLRAIADKHGCTVGRFGHGCIKNCDHVILFSSSFAVDCMLNGIKVKQGYPGYFHDTGAVTYCAGNVKMKLQDTAEAGYRLVNFLAWRYCFHMNMTTDEWKNLLRHFAKSYDLFPLTEEMSYAKKLLHLKDIGKI